MKNTFTTACYLIIVLSFCKGSAARENVRTKARLYPGIEVAGLYNLNKMDILASDDKRKLSAHNSGGFSAGLGFTLFKPKGKGGMFSLSAGYKLNSENFVTKPGMNENDIRYKNTLSALYLRPEVSLYFRVMERSFIHFGLYAEPNLISTETKPEYHLNYNKSIVSSYNTLTSSTYYHWGRNTEDNSLSIIPVTLIGFSAGFLQINSGKAIKMLKCRLFFEFYPRISLENDGYFTKEKRSTANIKYYEDNGANRKVISTDYYVDKMMRLGLSITVGV